MICAPSRAALPRTSRQVPLAPATVPPISTQFWFGLPWQWKRISGVPSEVSPRWMSAQLPPLPISWAPKARPGAAPAASAASAASAGSVVRRVFMGVPGLRSAGRAGRLFPDRGRDPAVLVQDQRQAVRVGIPRGDAIVRPDHAHAAGGQMLLAHQFGHGLAGGDARAL